MDDPARRLREVLNPRLTQATLAEDLGVTKQAVNNWCAGLARPSMKHRRRIEELTGIPRVAWMTEEERDGTGVDDGEAA